MKKTQKVTREPGISQDAIDTFHENLDFWYEDYLYQFADGVQDDENEWFLQITGVFRAGYGDS